MTQARLVGLSPPPRASGAWETSALRPAVVGHGRRGRRGRPAGGDKLPTDGQMKTANPELFAIAARYFPGETAAGAPKRLFRLTRTQLDATTKALLPAQQAASARRGRAARSAADQLRIRRQPRLQRRQLHALHEVGRRRSRRSVRANPASVIDCAPSGNSPACLRAEAQALREPRVSRRRRPTRSSRVTPTSSSPAWPRSGSPTPRRIWSTSR